MNGLHTSLYAAAMALCVFSAGLVGGRERRSGRPFDYFTVFLLIQALGFALELLLAHPDSPFKSVWLGLRLGTALFVAPVLWLAVLEVVDGTRPTFGMLGRRQLGLIGLGIVGTLPLIARAHGGTGFVNSFDPVSSWHAGIIRGGMLLCIAVFLWQAPHFLRRCRQILLEHAQLHEGDKAGRSSAAWLQLPLLIVATTWAFGVLRVVQCVAHAPARFVVLSAFVEVSIVVGAIYLIVRRSALLSAAPPIVATISPAPPAEAKYAKARLDPSVRARIQRKLEVAMTSGRLYTDSLLNLRRLSSELKESPHAVSQVINQDLHSNFYELLNRYRIEHAKQLLRQQPEQTVLEIALEVGFNSKSTFNTAFRRYTGTTPTEFRGADAQPGGAGIEAPPA